MANGNGQGQIADSPRIAALRAKLSQAEAARDAAKAAITEDDRTELAMREQIAKADAERAEEERVRRELDLDRRFDQAREAHPNAKISKLSIRGYEDTFILMHDSKAHQKWVDHKQQIFAGNKKLEGAEVTRDYAVAVVIDWNGIVDWGPTSLHGAELRSFLKAHPGIAMAIQTSALELAGVAEADSKS